MEPKMRIELLPHTPFLKPDGTFDMAGALSISGKIAGVCYNPEGFKSLMNESEETTQKRVNLTLRLEHHSVYDHVNVSLDLGNIPKILAMILNNEHQYNTSEKSARYTAVKRQPGSAITLKEEVLYNKWLAIFREIIKKQYGDIHNDGKTEKLSQENARYMVTVFMPTEMIYTVPLAQLNKIVSYMQILINNGPSNAFEAKLIPYLKEFISLLGENNLLNDQLQANRKDRSLSLFSDRRLNDQFGDSYTTSYTGSFAQLAQAHRHRTIDYSMLLTNQPDFYIPPIIENDHELTKEWLMDMYSVYSNFPQGQMVVINEQGTYENFILKCKERLCTAAQLEIAEQTKLTLIKMRASLVDANHYLQDDIQSYDHGCRNTFPDYSCASDCNFLEGKKLIRRI